MSDTVSQIVSTAQQFGVDPNLALAVAEQESGINQSARGAAGEIGIFQLLPSTAAGLGVDPTNQAQNIQGGVMYLAQLLGQFGGDVEKALAAYNWGQGNVAKAVASAGSNWLSMAPSSTQGYVAAIMANSPTVGGVSTSQTEADSTGPDGTTGLPPISTAGVTVAGISLGTIAVLVGIGVLLWMMQE